MSTSPRHKHTLELAVVVLAVVIGSLGYLLDVRQLEFLGLILGAIALGIVLMR